MIRPSPLIDPVLREITDTIVARNFRSFEFYFFATGLYLVMALGFRAALGVIYWSVFHRGRPA